MNCSIRTKYQRNHPPGAIGLFVIELAGGGTNGVATTSGFWFGTDGGLGVPFIAGAGAGAGLDAVDVLL